MNMMDKKLEPQTFITHHLIKSEDLNHHGTLYAGRTAEWFVESGFVSAASITSPENIVCAQIHGMKFSNPVQRGEVVQFESKIVYTSRSRMVSYIRLTAHDTKVVDGFITFVHVDKDGKAYPHGIEIVPVTEEDKILYQKAQELK